LVLPSFSYPWDYASAGKRLLIQKENHIFTLRFFFFLTGLHFFHLLLGVLLFCLLLWSCSFSFSLATPKKREDKKKRRTPEKGEDLRKK